MWAPYSSEIIEFKCGNYAVAWHLQKGNTISKIGDSRYCMNVSKADIDDIIKGFERLKEVVEDE